MIRLPRTKRGLLAYLFAIATVTFSLFTTSNSSLPKRTAQAPSPTPIESLQTAVLGTKAREVARVTKILSGDTFEIENGKTVRMIGVDAPDSGCFTKESTEFLTELLLDQAVEIQEDVTNETVDGHLLRYVYLNGALMNETLVIEGYAFARGVPPDIAQNQTIQKAERDALYEKRGIWDGTCAFNGN